MIDWGLHVVLHQVGRSVLCLDDGQPFAAESFGVLGVGWVSESEVVAGVHHDIERLAMSVVHLCCLGHRNGFRHVQFLRLTDQLFVNH